MTKQEIILRTLADLRIDVVSLIPPYSDEPELEAYLSNRLPEGIEIRTCEDFAHLGATCCEVCHYSYAIDDMYVIDLPDGRKAWVCDQVRWAIFPEERGKLRESNWKNSDV